MKYWFKNVADNIYIYPKSAPRNLILQTRTSDCNSALLFVIGITPLYSYIYCKFYYTHNFDIYQDIIVNISIILHFNSK